jgi:hypothetical protein
MSNKVLPLFINSAFDDAGLSMSAVRVYVHLCRRADNETRIAWPGVDSMARTVRANRTTIIDAIKELEARGFIKVSRQIGRRSNYEILPKYCWQPKSNQSETGNGNQSVIGNTPFPKTDGTVPQKRLPPVGNEERKVLHRRISKKKSQGKEKTPKPPEGAFPSLNSNSEKNKPSSELKTSPDLFGSSKAKPANQDEVISFFETDQTCIDVYCDRADAIAFWCKMEAKGWIRNVNGTNDWKVNARDYATNRWLPSGQLRGRDREAHIEKMKQQARAREAEQAAREEQERLANQIPVSTQILNEFHRKIKEELK